MQKSIECCDDKRSFTYSYDEYDALLNKICVKLSMQLSDKVSHLYYGFPCKYDLQGEMSELALYKDLLKDDLTRLRLGGIPCFDDDEFRKLRERIVLLTFGCSDTSESLSIDDSLMNDWIRLNPLCASPKYWTTYCNSLFYNLNLDIVVPDESEVSFSLGLSRYQVENLSFEITTKIIPVDVVMALSVAMSNQGLAFKDDRQLKLETKLFQEEVSSDMTLNLYKRAVEENNFSFDIMRTIYESGLELTDSNSKLNLKTTLGEYPIADLKFTSSVSKTGLKDFGLNDDEIKYYLEIKKNLNVAYNGK